MRDVYRLRLSDQSADDDARGVVKNAREVWVDTAAVERAGDLLMFLALVFVAYRYWRHARSEIVPSTLGTTSCVEHYRLRLMRERELSRDGWKFVLPFTPGLGLIIVGRALEGRPSSHVAAVIVAAAALFVGVLWAIARGRHQIEREIDALE